MHAKLNVTLVVCSEVQSGEELSQKIFTESIQRLLTSSRIKADRWIADLRLDTGDFKGSFQEIVQELSPILKMRQDGDPTLSIDFRVWSDEIDEQINFELNPLVLGMLCNMDANLTLSF